jgi:two-component system, OmpR family, alkaline phosphatase synthesis response regulator PhoP
MTGEKPKKILVVDDEPDVASLLVLMLTAQGYTVIAARDGQEALAKAHAEQPDLILLDVMLPVMDGYKVAHMLKSDARYRKPLIIMLTANVQEKSKETSLAAGADDYVAKPFDAAELLAKISLLLAGKDK